MAAEQGLEGRMAKDKLTGLSAKEAIEANLQNIDVGGGSSNILERNTIAIALASGIKPEQLVIVLDPVDLSRADRELPLGDYKIKKIKFKVDVPETDRSSEAVAPPTPDSCEASFESARSGVMGSMINQYNKRLIDRNELDRRYTFLKNKVVDLSKNTTNLREFMKGLVSVLLPAPIKMILLEEVMSKNTEVVYELINKFKDVEYRAICPSCKLFVIDKAGKELGCCGVESDEIIQGGKYILQDGFFTAAMYLSGYTPFLSSSSKYGKLARDIMQKVGKEFKAVIYEKPLYNKTMFEDYMLRGNLKDDDK